MAAYSARACCRTWSNSASVNSSAMSELNLRQLALGGLVAVIQETGKNRLDQEGHALFGSLFLQQISQCVFAKWLNLHNLILPHWNRVWQTCAFRLCRPPKKSGCPPFLKEMSETLGILHLYILL